MIILKKRCTAGSGTYVPTATSLTSITPHKIEQTPAKTKHRDWKRSKPTVRMSRRFCMVTGSNDDCTPKTRLDGVCPADKPRVLRTVCHCGSWQCVRLLLLDCARIEVVPRP